MYYSTRGWGGNKIYSSTRDERRITITWPGVNKVEYCNSTTYFCFRLFTQPSKKSSAPKKSSTRSKSTRSLRSPRTLRCWKLRGIRRPCTNCRRRLYRTRPKKPVSLLQILEIDLIVWSLYTVKNKQENLASRLLIFLVQVKCILFCLFVICLLTNFVYNLAEQSY